MGNTQGMPIFDDDELVNLSAQQRQDLKKQALEEIGKNEEIHKLLTTNPEIFASRRQVRAIVRREMKRKFNIP